MKQYFTTLLLLLLVLPHGNAQSVTQTVRGTVIDKISERPIAGANILIEGLKLRAVANEKGEFSIGNVPLGRQKVAINCVGYQPVTIPELLVTAGKEVVLEIGLEQKIANLNEVTVIGSKIKKGNVSNEFAGSSGRSFSVDEITRYAGGRNDPSKLVSNFAGVISNNDSRNDIVVRGNSPAGVLWRIEGLPSPNPNHYSTLGATGGPVSMLNTNALKTSDFYSGAFPAEYGNATAAVFDISLRAGNTEKHETTLQLNLFSGLEAMLEGPLGKKRDGASYLIGYRYSFAQIGQSLGLNVGTKAIPKYQDWVYNIQFKKTKAGKFSLFGIGGISNIDFIGKELDSSDFYSRKDQDSYTRIYTLMFGGKHIIDLSRKSYIKTVASYSLSSTEYHAYQYALPLPPYTTKWPSTNVNDKQHVFRIASFINTKHNTRLSSRAGFVLERFHLNSTSFVKEGKPASTPFDTARNVDDGFMLGQLFAQAKWKFSDAWSLSAGINYMYFDLNKSQSINPRMAITYQPNNKTTLSFSYGLQAQMQALPVYFYTDTTPGSTYKNGNRNLGFTKANHFVLGYENRFASNWRLKAEGYYQGLFSIPVEPFTSGFSMINAGNDFSFPAKPNLLNKGTGHNVGVELTLERFLSKGFYLLATGSVFDSKYKGSDGIERNTTYNYKYAANLLAGKEWTVGKKKTNAFTADIKMTTIGGRYATPVDITASIANGIEELDQSSYNSLHLKGYFRMDTKFGFRINGKHKKISQTFYLDLQNITNEKNIFLRRFNPLRGTVGDVYQIGFFPDILYRVQF
ncbi:TonB-dependent receptor [Parasediminibacterium sp. JCM 36343]|uniref:TonB-dependent receptor n=1 Tax=Parasediminibacterium sp. JCM 36343 TaxID=3374279 RepID=UPI00397E3DAD